MNYRQIKLVEKAPSQDVVSSLGFQYVYAFDEQSESWKRIIENSGATTLGFNRREFLKLAGGGAIAVPFVLGPVNIRGRLESSSAFETMAVNSTGYINMQGIAEYDGVFGQPAGTRLAFSQGICSLVSVNGVTCIVTVGHIFNPRGGVSITSRFVNFPNIRSIRGRNLSVEGGTNSPSASGLDNLVTAPISSASFEGLDSSSFSNIPTLCTDSELLTTLLYSGSMGFVKQGTKHSAHMSPNQYNDFDGCLHHAAVVTTRTVPGDSGRVIVYVGEDGSYILGVNIGRIIDSRESHGSNNFALPTARLY